MAKVALTGGAYQAYSVIASAQRSLNLFAEPMPAAQAEPAQKAHYPTPGLSLLLTLGEGPIRGILQAPNGIFYIVSGSGVWKVQYTGGPPLAPTFATTNLGSITPGLTTPVSMVDNGLALVIVDGHFDPTFTHPTAWTVDLATDAFSVIPNGGFFVGADRVDYLDGYFIFNQPFSQNFWISQFMLPSFDPAGLDFAAKITHSDLLITLIVSKRLVYLFGSRMTEIWYNAGATDIGAGSFPFAEMQSEVIIDHGTAAKYSPAVYDNSVFWLAHNRAGEHIVMQATGYQTKRVSTYAIESHLGAVGVTDDAIGFCYLAFGHAFYVLTFPTADQTWVYDITTELWHEWLWVDNEGVEHRHRAMSYSILGDLNGVGDWQNGNVYALYGYTDNGQPVKRQRSFPHMIENARRVFYREFIADMETGNTPPVTPDILLDATFTAPNGTMLDTYISDIGGGWTPVDAADTAEIENDMLLGTGGATLYHSAVVLPSADYSLQFDAVPSTFDTVVSGTSLLVIARASGAGNGYRATVSADGTQYTLTLDVVGGSATASVVMGTLTSGRYTVWLVLSGSLITAKVQRSSDTLGLASDGTWGSSPLAVAAQFTDATYAAAGAVMIGGTWPTTPPTTLTYTMEVASPSDPNFPTPPGYGNQTNQQAFDFGRNWFYQPIFQSPNGGIAVTDLSSMTVIKTATLNQMYAGTSFGHPAGSPPSQTVYGVTTGSNTDLYILMDNGLGVGVAGEFCRFTRVDPVTMKVTGEFFTSAAFPPPVTCVMPGGMGGMGAVNTTSAHTVVVYATNGALGKGPEIFNGTGMAPIGPGTAPALNTYKAVIIPGARHLDGSCDFIYLNPDWNGTSGNVEIWRINVTDAMTFTDTLTGTLNVLSIIPSTAHNVFVWQADYDITHDTIILNVTPDSGGTHGAIISVNYDGSINWVQGPPIDGGDPFGSGQSLLNGTTYMTGASGDLTMLNTLTGAIEFTGSINVEGSPAGSFYRVWDASREAYWTFGLSRGFVRIEFDAGLAMDNVICGTSLALAGDICLDWSNDRGHTFGNPVCQPFGDFLTSLQWQRLGMARDRVFRLTWWSGVHTALQGAWVTAIAGDEDNEMAGQGGGGNSGGSS